jgi:hypothetical protein
MAKPVTKKPTRAKPSTAKGGLPDGVTYTDDDTDDQEVMLIVGKIGAGKTFTAVSASQCRTKPAGKEPKMTDLEDMLWGEVDSKACAGFKHNNLRVRRYNFAKEMSRTGKSITYVIQKFMEKVADLWHPDLKVVIDTITSLDALMFNDNFKRYRNHPNHREVYKQNLGDHSILSQDLKALGAHLIYCCHGRAFAGDSDKEMTVRLVGGGEMVPDITGQAPKFYNRDASLQMGVLARRPPKSKAIVRTLLFGVEADSNNIEGKNRYEGLLPDSMSPPDLKKVFEIIKKGKSQ